MGTAVAFRMRLGRFAELFRSTKIEFDTIARPRDGIVVFAVMWGMAMIFSAVSQTALLRGNHGLLQAAINWTVIGVALALVMNPRRTRLLGLLSLLMIAQYALRMPVSSNNQTIALFMNISIVAVIGIQVARNRSLQHDREQAFERLRVVARALLAIMYFLWCVPQDQY